MNRRLLVAVTYAILLGLMVMVSILRPLGLNVFWLLLAIGVVSRGVFGRMVKQTLLGRRWGKTLELGLAPKQRRDEDELDERELAVRNAAYFSAYRLLAVYSFIFVPVLLSGSATLFALRLLAGLLLIMALTLPQAVVLWTEPDVPEEARV